MDISAFYFFEFKYMYTISLVLLCALAIQLFFYLLFMLNLLLHIKKVNKNIETTNSLKKTSVIYFIEKWGDEETAQDLKTLMKNIGNTLEVIVIITADYLLEGKMLLEQLKKKYPSNFSFSILHDKTKGIILSKFALLSGARIAKYDYIAFIRPGQCVGSGAWGAIPSLYTKKNKFKHAPLFIGYSNLKPDTSSVNFIARICNFYTQVLSCSLLVRGIHFLSQPRNVFFKKSQYLNELNAFRKTDEVPRLMAPFIHLDYSKYKSIICWGENYALQENLTISWHYFLQISTYMIRKTEQNIKAFVLFSAYSFSYAILLVGLIWLYVLEQYGSAAFYYLLIALGIRCIVYWTTLIYLAKKAGEPKSILYSIFLLDILFGLFSAIIGILVWTLKSFKK